MGPATYKSKRTFIGQLPRGADLYESLTRIVDDEKIELGRISAIGATTHAVIAYYDQIEKQYKKMDFPGGMEILSCTGNVSLRDWRSFVHIHIILGDSQGRVVGGHVMPGTKVFACEVFIEEFDGRKLVRKQDEETGLFLWERESQLL